MLYPLIPWFAVMAAGYCFGHVMRLEPKRRQHLLRRSGFTLIGLFILLRAANIYGDPQPWEFKEGALATLLSFINCEKYPPSLLFLLMTIGPAMLMLASLDNQKTQWLQPFKTFGKVPLFFYLIHLPVIHLLAIGIAFFNSQPIEWLFIDPFFSKPNEYGYGLPFIYSIWLVVLLILYPLCSIYKHYKRTHKNSWMKYI